MAASKLTYKSLYQQIEQLINKKVSFNNKKGFSNQLDSSSVSSLVSTPGVDINAAKVVKDIIDILSQAIPAHISEGFAVVATDPISANVTVQAGTGSAGGFVYTLAEDTTVPIPFDSTTTLFYINIYKDTIFIEKNQDVKKLTLAKIVVPNPGTTNVVQDTKDDSFNAYIINFQEYKLYGDAYGHFEEETVELLRDNIGAILADNLIGNIRLNEDLKITNTQGTVLIDSKSLNILDVDGNILSKFNKDGTFIYDSDGQELAKFTGTEARIGNIKILPNAIQSENFVEGVSGFRIQDDGSVEFSDGVFRGNIAAATGTIGGWTIESDKLSGSGILQGGTIRTGANVGLGQDGIIIDSNGLRVYDAVLGLVLDFSADGDGVLIGNIAIKADSIESSNFVADSEGFQINSDGSAEFENIKVRGVLSTVVLQKDTISAIGGNFFVAEADVLTEDMTALDSSTLTIKGDANFVAGDILRIKNGFDDEWFQVVSADSGNTYTVTRDMDSAYTADNNPAWTKGAVVVNYGSSGSGIIFMTGSESNSPYMSIITHEGEPWTTTTERLRLGKLNGFLDYDESGSDVYGIAIGETTKYLKYDPDGGLVIRGDLTMDTGHIGGPDGWLITEFSIVGSPSARLMAGQTGYGEGTGFYLGWDDTVSGEDPAYKFSIGDDENYLRWNGVSLLIKGSLIMGDGSSIGSGVISADSFEDTVAGDISIGAVFARNTLDANVKYTETQSALILELGEYESGNPASLVITEGQVAVPPAAMWDESGRYWDESGRTWDGVTREGTYYYYSNVKNSGASYNCLPVLYATRNLTADDDSIAVHMRYSVDNVTWSDWAATSRIEKDGTSRYYFNDLVTARYFQYRITFVSAGTATLNLADLVFKVLAIYKTLIYPDQSISAGGTTLTGLSEHFSREYAVDVIGHGTSLVRGQISKSVGVPDTLTIHLVDESNVAVSGTADIKLIGY